MENKAMSYQEFCDYIEGMISLYSTEKSYCRFRILREGYQPEAANTEDCALVRKLNRQMNGLSSDTLIGDHMLIRTRDGAQIRASMRELYGVYKEYGTDGTAAVLAQIITSYPPDFLSGPDRPATFGEAEHSLFIRPVNIPVNRGFLQNSVYRSIGDIALALYFLIDSDAGTDAWIKVPGEVFLSWNMSEDEVFGRVLKKQARENPPRIYDNPFDALKEDTAGGDFMNDPDFALDMFSCLTTKKSRDGAIALFYPGVAQRIAQMAGGSFYAVFISADIIQIHRKNDLPSPQDAAGWIGKLNRAFDKENVLSDLIYEYDPASGKLRPVAGSAEFAL